MALDKVLIGDRIRRIREGTFEETRGQFAIRCNLTERHIGQIERGEFLFKINTLDKIVCATGIDANYILYGEGENKSCKVKENLKSIIEISTKDEANMYYKCITTIRGYINKKDKR